MPLDVFPRRLSPPALSGVAVPLFVVYVVIVPPLPPLAAIVIPPAELVIVMLDPAVRVAANGGSQVDPMMSWPSVNGPSHENAFDAPVE